MDAGAVRRYGFHAPARHVNLLKLRAYRINGHAGIHQRGQGHVSADSGKHVQVGDLHESGLLYQGCKNG